MRNKTKNELFVLENFPQMSAMEIAKYLNITIPTVRYYIKKNDLFHAFRFSKEENQFMKDHYKDMTYKEIANKLGYTERQIRGRINNMGLTKLRQINDTYFDAIDTPLKAYFLGYIFADGWIHIRSDNRGHEFGMELQYRDKYILERLNEELGGLNVISYKEPEEIVICGNLCHSGKSACLRVYSSRIVRGLMKNGIETNKTLKEVFPIVNEEYFFDFLRGYIDGDGCFWKIKNHCYMHITCATDKVLLYIQNVLQTFDIKTSIYKEHDKKHRLICTNIDSMKKLVNHLYHDQNALFLYRKYELVKSYLDGSAA
jgi:DNA-binding CsgD family transcriptional regulator